MPGYIAADECETLFDELLNTLPWRQETVVDGDETYQQPRMTAWFGEHPYSYAGVSHPPYTEVNKRTLLICRHTPTLAHNGCQLAFSLPNKPLLMYTVSQKRRNFYFLSVCLSAFLHDGTKTAETTITKLATGIVYHESWLAV